MPRRRVLVLCTGNTARTQMAEGLFRELGGERVEIHSAGTQPSYVHPLAIEVMRERGIDISHHRSKSYDEFLHLPFDDVITVCDAAAEACPTFPGPARRQHWSFPDPVAAEGDDEARRAVFRQVRDAIEARVRDWLVSAD